jgi:hypothetical protein
LVYADDVNLLGDNTDTIKRNTETLTDSRKEVGLEEKAEKTIYMLPSHHQNEVEIHDKKITNRSFENLAQFKYLGMTVKNQNLTQEEINWRLNLSTACYHSVQKLSSLLSRNVKIGIY